VGERKPATLERASVAVLLGGVSSEREISLATGRGVLDALRDAGDGRGPARVVAIEIEADGRWNAGDGPREAARIAPLLAGLDAVFLALHGGDGENGVVQGFLRTLGVAFTGPGARASAIAMDKWCARAVAVQAGLAVAPAALCRREDGAPAGRDDLEPLLDPRAGAFVKPRCGGSSVGVTCARDRESLVRGVEAVLETGDEAVVERGIAGREVSCGVLGNRGEPLSALTPVGIEPTDGGFFDWRQKYSERGARETCPPDGVDAAALQLVRDAALAAHAALGCDGYSRTDLIVSPAPGGGGVPVFLETNTLPGLTERSLLPRAAATDGLGYRELCLAIVELALRRDWRRHP